MKKMTYGEMVKLFREHNRKTNEDYKKAISGVIVYKQSNFNKPYSVESRSYRVSSCNRYFQDGKIANSVFGSCLDGTDDGVRLDWYNWDVEYCYLD